MIDLGWVVEAEAVPVQRVVAAGSYNAEGKYVPGGEPVDMQATVHPADGQQLMNLPEGVRSEAKYIMWSVSPVSHGDIVIYAGSRYKVIYTWPRPEGGFTRAALGLMANE